MCGGLYRRAHGLLEQLTELVTADFSGLEDLVEGAGAKFLVARDNQSGLEIGMLHCPMTAFGAVHPPARALKGLDRLVARDTATR